MTLRLVFASTTRGAVEPAARGAARFAGDWLELLMGFYRLLKATALAIYGFYAAGMIIGPERPACGTRLLTQPPYLLRVTWLTTRGARYWALPHGDRLRLRVDDVVLRAEAELGDV